MLTVNGLKTYYGRVAALHGVSFQVPEAAVVALIGANGAGKTTTLNTIAGVLTAAAGTVTYRGVPLHRAAPSTVVKAGIVLVPEGRELFREMTVRENLMMGAYVRTDRAGIAQDEEWIYQRFPILKERYRQRAGSLSGGEQQMLAISRALMARPSVLMLDEPSLGLAPKMVEQIFTIIPEIVKERQLAVLLVEQNVAVALAVSSFAYCLEHGVVTLQGTSADLLRNNVVQEYYLGRSVKEHAR